MSALSSMRPTRRSMLAVLCLAAALGCDGPGVASPDRPLLPIGGGAPTLRNALVGSWTRTFVFVDDFGLAQLSETTWQFLADGTASRSVTTTNLATGFADVVTTTAQWRVEDVTLVIDFETPTPGTVRLDLSIQDDQLTLAGEVYTRATA